MVLTVLLIVAAVCVALGVVLANVPLLVVSLAASVLAAFFLYRSWRTIKERRPAAPREQPPAPASGGQRPAGGPAATGRPDEVWVVDGRPTYHRPGCAQLTGQAGEPIPLAQALEDGFTACPTCHPPAGAVPPDPEVWVVDGSPEFHERGCEALVGRAGEPIPLSQALEDGFVVCPVCRPVAAGDVHQVWVVDGHPEYHREGCAETAGQPAEAIPYEQALEDGFQPCVVCDPDRAAGAVGAPHAPVWVVDGKPDYHRTGCRTLLGEDAEQIPHAQAVEDGFAACAVCDPEAEAAAAMTSVLAPVAAPEPVAEPPVAEPPVAPEPLAAEPVAPEPATARPVAAEPVAAEPVAPVPLAGGAPVDVLPAPEPRAAEPLSAGPAGRAEPGAVTAPAGPAEVWVVDGFPDYHRAGCQELFGLDAEPVPLEQAVEDGFAVCTVCRPDAAAAEPAAAPEPAAAGVAGAAPTAPVTAEDSTSVLPAVGGGPEPAAGDGPAVRPAVGGAAGPALPAEVWVADGYPDFHRPGCQELFGLDAEPVPLEQAVEDEFQPCPVCAPHRPEAGGAAPPAPTAPPPSTAAPAAPPPSAAAAPAPSAAAAPPREVRVVDGFPDYHRAGCPELAGLDEEPVPYEQAVEDGFTPCPRCRPDASGAAAEGPAEAAPGPLVPTEAPTGAPPGTPTGPAAGTPTGPAAGASAPAVTVQASPATGHVWVVDGRPRYHEQDCLIIKGQPAERVPLEQAVEDGFEPCSLCQRRR